MEPWSHQEECLQLIEHARLKGAQEGLIVITTAGGKTAISAFDVKKALAKNPSAKVLYLCHQNEILYQAYNTFKDIIGFEAKDAGFLNGIEKNVKAKFLFASFQTMIDNLQKFTFNEFDYVVVDESHHASADTYQPVVEYFKPDLFKLGMTATPERERI